MLDFNFTFFVQVINFLVLIAILNWLLIKPVMKIIDERRTKVESSEEGAKRLLQETDKALADYERKLAEVRAAAAREKESIRTEGIEREAEIVRAARDESRKMVDEIRERLSIETREASQMLKKDVELLSADIAEKVLGRKL